MKKSIEQKIKDNIRIGLKIIEHSNMGLLKNGLKATWENGKFKIVNDIDISDKSYLNYVDIEKAVEIIYKGV